ncbi:MAG TPA: alpha-L-fucosidase [Candidatus Hydrogenedentes bacterium]|jgi:alpha-L-fucosidase|nr:MAG: Alpha-L-fucosidase [Candidatus Hydrogenedentes bacterium ADurb.Bin170]HPX87321.1 alpha-L-fucosidase [Candidatus Hydrogenedentota bacterium]HQB03773.1 alpha-L-fucosidase [Candidatus Hydrogenedentota bacterium]
MTLAVALLASSLFSQTVWQPTWESIDSRPSPQWFEDAKFGIFIHWGVYSVPAWGPKDRYSEWYWHDMMDKKGGTWQFHVKTYGEKFKYQDFAPLFKAEMYDPQHWAETFRRSGAKYVVLTSKHHEGFSMWPDPTNWNWNVMDVGPHRDLAGDLVTAVRQEGLRAGFYYSFYEWFNPLYKSDVDRYVDQYMLPQLKDLVERYQPDLVWPDGEWEHPSSTWRSTEFLAWLLNESAAPKDVAINDRWGKDCRSIHGGFATPEYQHRPKGPLMENQRFEECQGMGKSFGYNRNETAENYRSATELIHLLIDTVSRGGNLLLDVGPRADGTLPEIMEERLLDMGKWLERNGEAIYGTVPWQNGSQDKNLRFTQKGQTKYILCLQWPGREIVLPDVAQLAGCKAQLLGSDAAVSLAQKDNDLKIAIPKVSVDAGLSHAFVIRLEP